MMSMKGAMKMLETTPLLRYSKNLFLMKEQNFIGYPEFFISRDLFSVGG